MMNLMRYRNSVAINSNRDIEVVKLEFLGLIKSNLERLEPTELKQKGDTLVYSAGIFRLVSVYWTWNLLTHISEGQIQVRKNGDTLCVNYEIQFTGLFVISLLKSLASLVIVEDFLFKFIVSLLVIIWLYGGNAGLTILRYKRFIKRTISEVLEDDAPQISKLQEEWISDSTKCDACGYMINHNDKVCPDCGISLI